MIVIIELSQSHLLYYVHIAYPGLGQAASHPSNMHILVPLSSVSIMGY